MDAKLVVVGGDAKPAEIKLRLPVIIGRGRQATLVLPHPLVSRKHCEIGECDGYLVVRDLGSLNGTFVNQRRVEQALLPPGGVLTLGGVSLQAVYAPAGPPPSDPALAARAGDGVSTCAVCDTDPIRERGAKPQQVFWDSKGTEPASDAPVSDAAVAGAAGRGAAGGGPTVPKKTVESDNLTAALTGRLPRPKSPPR